MDIIIEYTALSNRLQYKTYDSCPRPVTLNTQRKYVNLHMYLIVSVVNVSGCLICVEECIMAEAPCRLNSFCYPLRVYNKGRGTS